jgi:hypothetical protein
MLFSAGTGVFMAMFAAWFLTRHQAKADFIKDRFGCNW